MTKCNGKGSVYTSVVWDFFFLYLGYYLPYVRKFGKYHEKNIFYPFLISVLVHPYHLYESICSLTLKAPITIAADNIHKYFFTVFQRK